MNLSTNHGVVGTARMASGAATAVQRRNKRGRTLYRVRSARSARAGTSQRDVLTTFGPWPGRAQGVSR